MIFLNTRNTKNPFLWSYNIEMKTKISYNQEGMTHPSQKQVEPNIFTEFETSFPLKQNNWIKTDIILLCKYLYPLILLDKGEWINQPKKGLIQSIFTKVGEQVFVSLYHRKASYHFEIMNDTGLGKSSVNYCLDKWVQYGFVEKHSVSEIGRFGKYRPPVVYAIKGTDPSIIVQTKSNLSRLYRKKNLNKSTLKLLEYVDNIVEEIILKNGCNPSRREIQEIVRSYDIRGSDVELLVTEVTISLKSLRIDGSGG
jgi:hypothetical protein